MASLLAHFGSIRFTLVIQQALSFFSFLVAVIRGVQQQNCFRHAAALSFYAFLGLPALLSVFFWITNIIVSSELVEQRMIQFIATHFGEAQSQFIGTLAAVTRPTDDSLLPLSLAELGSALLAASGFLLHLQYSLNTIWHLENNNSKNFLLGWIVKRGISISLLLVIGLVFFISLFATTITTLIYDLLSLKELQRLGLPEGFSLWIIQSSFSLIFLLAAITILYVFLPDKRISARLALIGAVVASLLLVIGKEFAAWYIASQNFETSFGAASSLAAFLLWIYYSLVVFLLGAVWSATCIERSMSHKILVDTAPLASS